MGVALWFGVSMLSGKDVGSSLCVNGYACELYKLVAAEKLIFRLIHLFMVSLNLRCFPGSWEGQAEAPASH